MFTLSLNSDIDECAADTFTCDANAGCTNTYGSYTCTCNAGYSGNGKMCTGKELLNLQIHR